MMALRNCFLFIAIVTGLIACTHKKKPSMSGENPVEVADFIDFFPEKKLPFSIADTSLAKKEKDSLLISYKVFTQFIPDSVANKMFGKGIKPRIYPVGKVKEPGDATYLFIKAFIGERKAAFVFAFDKKDKLIDGLSLLQIDNSSSTAQTLSMDKSYSVYKSVTRKNADGSLSEGKDVYSLDKSAGKFMLIMTNALDGKVAELINPIDTLPRKNKYSADYGSGTRNLVSIRDGRKSDRLSFFIHFEKNKGNCTGELKGEAIIKSPNMAEYRQNGDPCILRISFTASSVILKEVEGCGAHRGLRCSFDGSYSRKKGTVPKEDQKKKSVKK